jgi:putative endonuclease
MTYFCYIIYSKTLDRYYVGHTEDVDVRLIQHNSGISTFTAKAQDWVLLYRQEFETREEARKREFEIKKKKSRKYIEWIISAG